MAADDVFLGFPILPMRPRHLHTVTGKVEEIKTLLEQHGLSDGISSWFSEWLPGCSEKLGPALVYVFLN